MTPGCERTASTRDLCRLHYQRWRKYGDSTRERPTLADRLTAGATRGNGCWPWRGAHDELGYGIIKVDGRPQRVHRVAWTVAFGAIPAGLNVLHSCDNPPCIRPDHLMLGTQRANVQDMLAKGRRPASRSA